MVVDQMCSNSTSSVMKAIDFQKINWGQNYYPKLETMAKKIAAAVWQKLSSQQILKLSANCWATIIKSLF